MAQQRKVVNSKIDIAELRGDLKRIEEMLKMSIAEQRRFNQMTEKNFDRNTKRFERLESRIEKVETDISTWGIYNKAVIFIVTLFTLMNIALKFWH